MASPMLATSGTAVPYFQSSLDVQTKANSPYGLPLVEDCVTCRLRNHNSFCNLSPAATKALNEIKHVTSYPEGAVVFMEGQSARGVYVVCQGRAKLMTTSSDGRTLILKIAEAGELLGLHATISGQLHECTVETLQPCQLAFVRRDDFLRFINEHGEACLQAAQSLSRDCQSAYEAIRSIGLCHSVSGKLARLLLQWAAEGRASDGVIRVKVSLTHEEIAQLIGSSRETVTRTLGEFKKQRYAELAGSTLIVRNKAALEKMAE